MIWRCTSSHEDIVARENVVGGLEERGYGHDMGVRKSKQLVAARLLLMANAPLDFLPPYPAPLAISWAAIYRMQRGSARENQSRTPSRCLVSFWNSFYVSPAILIYWGSKKSSKRTETRSKGWIACEAANPRSPLFWWMYIWRKQGEQGTERPWQRIQFKPTEAYNIGNLIQLFF